MVKKIPRSSLSKYLIATTFIIIMENNIKKLYLIRTKKETYFSTILK